MAVRKRNTEDRQRSVGCTRESHDVTYLMSGSACENDDYTGQYVTQYSMSGSACENDDYAGEYVTYAMSVSARESSGRQASTSLTRCRQCM